MLGAGAHVVLAGEAAVHQGLDEITPRAFLGLVDAALPQHLRPDDRGGLFGEHLVPRQIVLARAVGVIGSQRRDQDGHPALERLAQPDRARHTRPPAVLRAGDLLRARVVAVVAPLRRREVGGQHPAHRIGQGGHGFGGQAVVGHHMTAGIECHGGIARQVGHLAHQDLQTRATVEQPGQGGVHVRRVAHDVHLLAERALGQQPVEGRETHRDAEFHDHQPGGQPAQVRWGDTVDQQRGRAPGGKRRKRRRAGRQRFGARVHRHRVQPIML